MATVPSSGRYGQTPYSARTDGFRQLITTQSVESYDQATRGYKTNYLRKLLARGQPRWSASVGGRYGPSHHYHNQEHPHPQGGQEPFPGRLHHSKTSLGLRRDYTNVSVGSSQKNGKLLPRRGDLTRTEPKPKPVWIQEEHSTLTTDAHIGPILPEIKFEELYQTAVDVSKDEQKAGDRRKGRQEDEQLSFHPLHQPQDEVQQESEGGRVSVTRQQPVASSGWLDADSHQCWDDVRGSNRAVDVLVDHEETPAYQPLQRVEPLLATTTDKTPQGPEAATRPQSVPLVSAASLDPEISLSGTTEPGPKPPAQRKRKLSRKERRRAVPGSDPIRKTSSSRKIAGSATQEGPTIPKQSTDRHRLSTCSLFGEEELVGEGKHVRRNRRKISDNIWDFVQTCRGFLVDPSSRGLKVKEAPLLHFKRAVKMVMLLLRATSSGSSRRNQNRAGAKLMSFAQYQDELLKSNQSVYGTGLTFDVMAFKAQKETHISLEAKTVLCMAQRDRTEEQQHVALVALHQAVDAFAEFPINMQRSLVRVGWYEHFEAKRVIIRQGHFADNFYFILSGTAVVTILETDNRTGESYVRTAAFLGRGNSFGELALMHGATRSATVTCKDDVELLAVGREDFIDIFMHVEKNTEPEHIQYLRQIDLLRGWPIHKLPWNDTKICLFTYFRRGTVMCRDSNKSDWVYVIKSGTCRVLKSLQAAKPDIAGLTPQQYTPDPSAGEPSQAKSRGNRMMTSTSGSLDSGMSSITVNDRVQNKKKGGSVPYSRGLPPIRQRSVEEIQESSEEHQQTLNEVYNEKHEKERPHRTRQQTGTTDNVNQPKPETVFVQVQKLGPRETFGFEPVAFSLMEKCTSVSLVSDGAEAVLISRKFFTQHLSDDMRKKLRTTIQPYPSEESLQQKLQDKTNWAAYKASAVNDFIVHKKFVHDTLFL